MIKQILKSGAIAATLISTPALANDTSFMDAQRAMGGTADLVFELPQNIKSLSGSIIRIYGSADTFETDEPLAEQDVNGSSVSFKNLRPGRYGFKIIDVSGKVVSKPIPANMYRDSKSARGASQRTEKKANWDNMNTYLLSGRIIKTITPNQLAPITPMADKQIFAAASASSDGCCSR